ncbi:hypothetical protein GW781_05410 [bacterium]|nr:hypothetical protein [bacterium]NCT20575.1 hypothetical protein [bacterium]
MQKLPVSQPQRESLLKHRRQVMRQIVLPLGLATLAALALTVWAGVVAFSGGSATRGAAIAIIWMSIPTMLGMLVLLLMVAAAVYGLSKLLGATPHYTGLAQQYTLRYTTYIQKYARQFTSAVIRLSAWLQIFQKREK